VEITALLLFHFLDGISRVKRKILLTCKLLRETIRLITPYYRRFEDIVTQKSFALIPRRQTGRSQFLCQRYFVPFIKKTVFCAYVRSFQMVTVALPLFTFIEYCSKHYDDVYCL
jgi:hypothetical protein